MTFKKYFSKDFSYAGSAGVSMLAGMQIRRVYDFGGEVDWEALEGRMGRDALLRRVHRQNLHYTSRLVRCRRFWSRQLIKRAAEWGFWLTGLSGVGHRNFRKVQVVENEVRFSRLPEALSGLRMLQISDLHLDLDPGLTQVVVRKVQGLDYDLAVLTGDFRNATYGDFHPALEHTREIVVALQGQKRPVFGILGNHDYLEMAVGLEAMGVRMLLNEAVAVTLPGREAVFWLAGVDDPNLYRTHDVGRASEKIPPDAFKVLLSHAPETYEEAAMSGFDFFMCGHTHGGQICLPGGVPVITHCKAPRLCARGNWEWKGMRGFTTTGTGGCGAALRLNCLPEIVIHELCRK